MPSPDDLRAACVDEDQALDFVQGHLSAQTVQRIDEHTDRCPACRALIGEAVRAFRERTTEAGLQHTPLTRFNPGEQLAGRYRVVRFIARGGMGEVYEAEDLMLSTRIALKTLAATMSDDQQAIQRLKLEVNLARRITHPNVCRIFDLGVHEQPGSPAGGVLFITMELVPGVSLGQRLRDEGALPSSVAHPIVESMVAALSAAHRAGIIHRDFKSDNVMLAPPTFEGGPPRVVVMDFGLARASVPGIPSISTTFDSRSLVGTLAYMAPEQVQGKPVTAQTDVYALGVVMYEMITGELPFLAASAIEAASRRLAEDPRAPSELTKDLDPRWEAVILRCLARDPERRFQAVDEVAAALRKTLPYVPRVQAPAKAGSARPARMPLWRMWPVALGTAFLVSALVVAAWMRSDVAAPRSATSASPPLPAAVGPAVDRAVAPPPAEEEAAAIPEPAPAPAVEAAATKAPSRVRAPIKKRTLSAVERRGEGRVPAAAATAEAEAETPPLASTPDSRPVEPRRSTDPENGFILP